MGGPENRSLLDLQHQEDYVALKPVPQALLIAPDPIMRLRCATGDKKISIREGFRDFRIGGVLALYCPGWPWSIECDITFVRYCTLRQVTKKQWAADGFTSQPDLLVGLQRFYPKVTLDSPVTIIRWNNARGKYVDDPEMHLEHLESLVDTNNQLLQLRMEFYVCYPHLVVS